MVDFDETGVGVYLRQELSNLARRAGDLFREIEGLDILDDSVFIVWLKACNDWREASMRYTDFKQEYEDNNKHYILGDFDDK